jgi:hypothetical protein
VFCPENLSFDNLLYIELHFSGIMGIGHWSLVIGHWSLVIGHWSLVKKTWNNYQPPTTNNHQL